MARGEPVEFSEAERIRKDDRRIFIDLSVSPIRDASGTVVGASSIKRDITEQIRIRKALAAETARGQDLVQLVGRDVPGGEKTGYLQGKRCPPHPRPQVWTVLWTNEVPGRLKRR